MEKDEILIRQAVIHILDSSIGMPILSEYQLELGPDLNEMIRGQIYKVASGDDMKKCVFNEGESEVFQMIQEFSEENMVECSKRMSEYLYTIMQANVDIPSADLLFATYQVHSTVCLAILKLNYKESFMHLTGNDDSGANINHIIKQKATLPSASTKLSEAVLINLSDYTVQIVEKKYDVNGKKMNYLSELFLKCHAQMSQKTKIDIVTKAVEAINKKYYEEDFDKKMEVKSIIQNEIEEQGNLSVETLSEKIYKDEPEILNEFKESMEKYHMEKATVEPQSEATVKKFRKQFLTTDTGIEINIPMEQYNNKNNVEFITNPDGTISIMIKNIGHITTK